eukprot:gnl/MRDRNA2_/MRDRNA2_28977_c0_seq1.p1 gnl/MRDRNA2_/MRDRNA2_28977_c0~~gnl/MRDRNA2_/MRDRNA2_28977_c0_seq1.p1  ORF type:complete len:457 (+),score=85.09 gnl/MRDRNA2_/MRDRNA2_28977_c0_seq1:95-1465(+)
MEEQKDLPDEFKTSETFGLWTHGIVSTNSKGAAQDCSREKQSAKSIIPPMPSKSAEKATSVPTSFDTEHSCREVPEHEVNPAASDCESDTISESGSDFSFKSDGSLATEVQTRDTAKNMTPYHYSRGPEQRRSDSPLIPQGVVIPHHFRPAMTACIPADPNDGMEMDCDLVDDPYGAGMGSRRPSRRTSADILGTKSRRRSSAIVDVIAAESDLNELEQEGKAPNAKVAFDTLTIRTWFMGSDKTNKGFLTKREFVNFLIQNPGLMKKLVPDLGEADGDKNLEWHVRRAHETPVARQARVQKRLMNKYRQIIADKGNCLDFQGFLSLFQQAGCVLEYQGNTNPRDLAAEKLAAVEGTGPIGNMNELTDQARRGSEQKWATDLKSQNKHEEGQHMARRRNTFSALCSPACFWEETVVLGKGGRRSFEGHNRRRSWGPNQGVSDYLPLSGDSLPPFCQ